MKNLSILKYLKDDVIFCTNKINQGLDSLVQKKYWKLLAALIIALSSYAVSFPDYDQLAGKDKDIIDDFLEWQFEHPLSKYPHIQESIEDVENTSNVSHINKRWIRITVPILSKTLHLSPDHWLYIMPLLSIVFLILFISVMERILKDKKNAVIIAFGFGFTFQLHWFFCDDICYDCVAWLLILIGFYYKNNRTIFIISALMALFTDERSILGLIMIQFYNHYEYNEMKFFPIKNLSKLALNTFVYFFLPVFLYLLGRWALLKYTDLIPGYTSIGLKSIIYNYRFLPATFWVPWEGILLIFISSFWILRHTERKVTLLFFLLAILLIHLSCFVVLDLSRSIGYYYPLIFLSALILERNIDYRYLNMFLIFTSVISIIAPSHLIKVDGIYWISPIFPKIMKFLFIQPSMF
jgi:hypothetical protein